MIITKRDGGELNDDQVDWMVDAYTRGVVADEQMAAMAMAILLNGMTREEIARWTAAMIASGERMEFSALSRPTADKHSTGGVGDKITCRSRRWWRPAGSRSRSCPGAGWATPAARSTSRVDPGWRASLSNDEMMRQLEDVGAVICAAGVGAGAGRQEALRAA